MTMGPVKDQLENIINLPQNMPAKLMKILTQGVEERSWEDVLELQKATWKIPDFNSRQMLDAAVQKSYQARYGDEAMRLDASGRPIMEEKEWNPRKGREADKIAQVGIKLRKVAATQSREDAFRGLEYGLNLLRGINDKAVKVCGDFDVPAQNLFDKILQKNSSAKILQAVKTGLISDCLISYQNKNLSGDDKKKKVAKIINIFDQDDKEERDFAYGEEEAENASVNVGGDSSGQSIAEEEKLPDDIKGFVWISHDGCAECQGNNGKFFTADEVPSGHPNCRCSIEVVFKEEEVPETAIANEQETPTKELSEAEKKKRNEEIYRRNLKDLEHFEGKKNFIYLDTEGNMTTGNGTNVEDKQVFKKVKFRDEKGRELADDEKEALYNQIQEDKKQIKNVEEKTANHYRGKWKVQIDDDERQTLMKEHVEADLNALRKMCQERGKDFDKLPPSQQDALLDMHYNMGSINPEKWVKFYDAFNIDDYDDMGEESHRKKPVPKERNEWTRKKFEKAKTEAQNRR